METEISYSLSFPLFRFKSYYVVWKPSKIKFGDGTQKVFKSYYVVWKQEKNKEYEAMCESLNRTM